ncbi:MAG: hypothetical protein ABSF82_08855 [Candidatus Bathyarchaeia archaeon]
MESPIRKFSYGRVTLRYGGSLPRPQIMWDGLDLVNALRTPVPTDELVHDVCELLCILLKSDKHYWHATLNRFFEAFTPTWKSLVREGKISDAASMWIHVLSSVRAWENRSGNLIHKGTPYYFLGATYLYGYDFDRGLRYIFDAFEEDKRATSGDPTLYKAMPAYKVASLIDQPDNYLYPELVLPARIRIDGFLKEYRSRSGSTMQMADFESKFLSNSVFEIQKFFFVYSLLETIKHEATWEPGSVRNEFSEMRNRDLLFDLCIVVDEILRVRFPPATFISAGVFNLCRSKGWVTLDSNSTQLNQNLNPKVAEFPPTPTPRPDVVVPTLLDRTMTYRGAHLSQEMSWMLLAWHLRNYAAHDLSPQGVLVKRHNEITQALMNALFTAIE